VRSIQDRDLYGSDFCNKSKDTLSLGARKVLLIRAGCALIRGQVPAVGNVTVVAVPCTTFHRECGISQS